MIYWYQNLYMDETVEKKSETVQKTGGKAAPMEKELRRAYLGAE